MDNAQQELPGLPPLPTISQIAVSFLNQREIVKREKETLDGLKEELIALFQHTNTDHIHVDAHTIAYQSKITDNITVKSDVSTSNNGE